MYLILADDVDVSLDAAGSDLLEVAGAGLTGSTCASRVVFFGAEGASVVRTGDGFFAAKTVVRRAGPACLITGAGGWDRPGANFVVDLGGEDREGATTGRGGGLARDGLLATTLNL